MTSSYLNDMYDVTGVNVFPRKLMEFPPQRTGVTGPSSTTNSSAVFSYLFVLLSRSSPHEPRQMMCQMFMQEQQQSQASHYLNSWRVLQKLCKLAFDINEVFFYHLCWNFYTAVIHQCFLMSKIWWIMKRFILKMYPDVCPCLCNPFNVLSLLIIK